VVTLGIGVAAGTGAYASGLRKSERGLVLIAGAGVGLLVLARQPRRASWLAASGATFAVLLAGTHDLLPGYADRFSLRRMARAQAATVAVYCYPQPFDAVSFYLRRDDIRVFRA